MQRITDIWRNLVRYYPPNEENQRPEDESEDESEDRDAEIAETYRNQYWTRLVSLQQGLAQNIERWPLALDLIESLTEIDGLEGRQGNEAQFIFDPAEFLQRNPTPTLTEFKLDEG